MIILILGFVALAAAKTPSFSLQNSLEPPLDYIPVNSGADIQSSDVPSASRPQSSFPGPGYILPECPNGKIPPCDEPPAKTCPNGQPPPCEQPPVQTCPNGKPPPCEQPPVQTCPNGKPPPCVCKPPLVGTPPNCRADKYLPVIHKERPQCPQGTYGTPPNCTEIIRQPIRCPPGWLGDFYPNCTYRACPPGQVGIYPNCITPPDVPYCYKERKLGTWPDCYDPCPAYQMGRPDKEPFCRPIPCPTGKGWTGDYQPNCVYTPMCPDDAPGIWPDCRELYCTANFRGNYPDCECPPPFILKSKDECVKPAGYNPLNE